MLARLLGFSLSFSLGICFLTSSSFGDVLSRRGCEARLGYYDALEKKLGSGPITVRSKRHFAPHPLASTHRSVVTLEERADGIWEIAAHSATAVEARAPLSEVRSSRGRGGASEGGDRVRISGEKRSVLRTNHPLIDFEARAFGFDAPLAKKFVSVRFFRRLARLSKESEAVFLDFACGNGSMVRDMRRLGVAVYGTDIILPPHLIDSSMRASDLYLCADGVDTGLRSNRFSGVFAFYSPYWNSTQESLELQVSLASEFLEEHFRILRPGGFLMIGPAELSVMDFALDSFRGFEVYERSRVPVTDPAFRYPEAGDYDPAEHVLLESWPGEDEVTVPVLKSDSPMFDSPWPSRHDYLVLEKPTLSGEPTVLEHVFGPRVMHGDGASDPTLEDEEEYLRYLEQTSTD